MKVKGYYQQNVFYAPLVQMSVQKEQLKWQWNSMLEKEKNIWGIGDRIIDESNSYNSVFAVRFAHPNGFGTSPIRKTLSTRLLVAGGD